MGPHGLLLIYSLGNHICHAHHNNNNSNLFLQAQNKPPLSSDFIPGDTPTIYAGGGSTNQDSENSPQSSLFGATGDGLLAGISLLSLPAIIQQLGNLGLPNIGLNFDWNALGRQGLEGVVPNIQSKIGDALHDQKDEFGNLPPNFEFEPPPNKPLRGPDLEAPVWINGTDEEEQQFFINPLNLIQLLGQGGQIEKIGDNVGLSPNLLAPPPLGSPSDGQKTHKSGLPNGAIQGPLIPPKAGSSFLPSVIHSGPGPNSGTPFLPGLSVNQGHRTNPFPDIIPDDEINEDFLSTLLQIPVSHDDFSHKLPEVKHQEGSTWSQPEISSSDTSRTSFSGFRPSKPIPPPIDSIPVEDHSQIEGHQATDVVQEKNNNSTDETDLKAFFDLFEAFSKNSTDEEESNTTVPDSGDDNAPVEIKTGEPEEQEVSSLSDLLELMLGDKQEQNDTESIINPKDLTTEVNKKIPFLKDGIGEDALPTLSTLFKSPTLKKNLSNLGKSTTLFPPIIFDPTTSTSTELPTTTPTTTKPTTTATFSLVNFDPELVFNKKGIIKNSGDIPKLGQGVSVVKKPDNSFKRPGLVQPVDKSGDILTPSTTQVSPSRSVGQGGRIGVPTVQRVSHPLEQGVDLPPQQDREPIDGRIDEIKAEVSPLQDIGIKNTQFKNSDVSSIDWYFDNYHKEYDSTKELPVGGNRNREIVITSGCDRQVSHMRSFLLTLFLINLFL